MPEMNESGYDQIFGGDAADTVQKPAGAAGQGDEAEQEEEIDETEELEDDGSEEDGDEEDSETATDEEDEDSEEDESEDEDDSEEEKSKKGDPQVPIRALRAQLKEAQSHIQNYERMMSDPKFLLRQLQRLQPNNPALQVTTKDESGKEVKQSQFVPEAPYYDNTPEGRTDMRMDMHEVIRIVPEARTSQAIANLILGQVALGMSYVDAAYSVRAMRSTSVQEGKREGKEKREQQVANKKRLSIKPQPGAGKPSRTSDLMKRVKSGSDSDRLAAGAELLGI